MNRVRRWTAQITSSVDWMISQVENHEGLISAAIREVQEAGAHARVQLKRMHHDGQQMRKRLLQLKDQSQLWRARAKECAASDEERALECIRRARRHDQEYSDLEVREREHQALEQQLTKDLELIEGKLIELKQQRNAYRTRELRAEALSALQREEGVVISELDEIFERWEHKIAKSEYGNGLTRDRIDTLEESFSAEEERRALLTELHTIVSTNE